MSTRAIKKLTKKDHLKELEKAIKEKTSDEEQSEEETDFTPINKFNLVSHLFFKKKKTLLI